MVRRLGRKAIHAALFFCVVLHPGNTSASGVAAQERALTRAELIKLYAGNSWLWNDGSGYFAPSGRFVAVAGPEGKQSRVDGSWKASRDGRLCFSGIWRTKPKTRGKYAETCFAHRKSKGAILQRRLPHGEWYVFRSDDGKSTDQKLVVGDVTARASTR